MYIKRITDKKMLDVLQLAWDVFEEELADTYTEEGIQQFREYIKYANMSSKVETREMVFFKAMEGDQLCGMSAIRQDGHICLLYVKKEWQRKGAARKLFFAMQQYCVIERNIQQMTVDAVPSSVPVFQKFGFLVTRPEHEKNGASFVSMAYAIKEAREIAGGIITPKKRRVRNLISTFFFIGLVILNFIGAKYLLEETEQNMGEPNSSITQEQQNKPQDKEESEGSEKQRGLEAVESMISEELSYAINEEEYTFYSDKSSGKYQMEFDVKYPVLEGLDTGKEDEINELLKACAMSTVDVLYLNPSEDIKEALIKETDPVLVSHVTYKVTYASEEMISVAFEDHYVAGNSEVEYIDLRTRNINLKDGTCYEIKEIVDLSSDFVGMWRQQLMEENSNIDVFSELKTSEYRRILNGEILYNKYHDVFFIDKNGLQLGITFHYTGTSGMENGWATTSLAFDDIAEFQTESDFWNFVTESKSND